MKNCRPVVSFALALNLCLLTAGLRASAQENGGGSSQAEQLSRPVRAGAKTTFHDLLRELFPDLRPDATAHTTIPLGSLSEPRRKQAIKGDIELSFKPYWFRSEGRLLLLLWVELKAEEANQGTPYEGEAVVLAVYRLEPTFKLLDALEVKTDRFTGFWQARPLFRLDSRNDAFIVYSTHWNAGESYQRLDMLFVDAGRLKTIASQFIYDTQGCDAGFTETPYFRALPDPGNKYPRVLLQVRLTKAPNEETCDRPSRGYHRYYRGVFRWNPSRATYTTGSRQLERLDEFNQRRVLSSVSCVSRLSHDWRKLRCRL